VDHRLVANNKKSSVGARFMVRQAHHPELVEGSHPIGSHECDPYGFSTLSPAGRLNEVKPIGSSEVKCVAGIKGEGE
jgi:hypothetical protein